MEAMVGSRRSLRAPHPSPDAPNLTLAARHFPPYVIPAKAEVHRLSALQRAPAWTSFAAV